MVHAIVWAGGNVLDTIASDGRDTEEVAALRTVLTTWPALCAAYGPHGLTTSKVLDALYPRLNPREPPPPDDGWSDLRTALETLYHCPSGTKPTARGLGKRLAANRGRVLGGLRLRERTHKGTHVWWVDPAANSRSSTAPGAAPGEGV